MLIKVDFDKNNNNIKILCKNQSKQLNIDDDLFMFMACFGKGTVVATCEEMGVFMTKYIEKMDVFRCFVYGILYKSTFTRRYLKACVYKKLIK